jgi:hypothetical protein
MASQPRISPGRPAEARPARVADPARASRTPRPRAGAETLSVDERANGQPREGTADTVAGFLAAAALGAGVLSLVWYPGRIGPAAMLVALIAAGLADANRRLTALALTGIVVCWTAGMIIAVVTERAVF